MELLGTYNSQLTTAYYQQLLALLNVAISSGDLGGGSSFDKSSLLNLEQQAQSFAALPVGTATSRVTDDSFNYPLSLLQARIRALLAEIDGFTTISGRLLDVLANETALVDDLLAADSLAQWVSSKTQLFNAWSTAWDFSTGQGAKSPTLPPADPTTSVTWDAPCDIHSVFDCSTGLLTRGLRPPLQTRTFPFKSLAWSYATNGTPQELYAPDLSWAQLDLLEPLPRIDFSAPPAVQVLLPQGSASTAFQFTGLVPGGALPTYVRVVFHQRLNAKTATVTKTDTTYDPIPLSPYQINPNTVVIITTDGSAVFTPTTDYNPDPSIGVTPVNIPVSTQVNIYFQEYWPAYQCSVDRVNWSPLIMLDLNRPYPDDADNFLPLDIKDGLFPLMDESGESTGIYFGLLDTISIPYTLLVTTPPGTASGVKISFELVVAQPSFLNAVNFAPFAAFPADITQIEVEGLTSDTRHTEWFGTLAADQPIQITFPRQITTKIYLTMVQRSYTVKEYQSDSLDAMRRNVMNSLQSSLPFLLKKVQPAVPIVFRGYQYELGFENLTALDITREIPGVFVQGPDIVPGCPDVIRFEADVTGTVDIYLCYRAFNSDGGLVDENLSGFNITPGSARVFPYTSGTTLASIASTEIDFRFVLRTPTASVARYLLQATLH